MVHLLLIERPFKEGTEKRGVGGERLLKKHCAFVGQAHFGKPAIVFHRIPSNQTFVDQPIEDSGQGPFGHERFRREFGAGEALRVAEGRDDVELGWGQPQGPDVTAARTGKGQIGLHQRSDQLEIGIVVQIRQFHVRRIVRTCWTVKPPDGRFVDDESVPPV